MCQHASRIRTNLTGLRSSCSALVGRRSSRGLHHTLTRNMHCNGAFQQQRCTWTLRQQRALGQHMFWLQWSLHTLYERSPPQQEVPVKPPLGDRQDYTQRIGPVLQKKGTLLRHRLRPQALPKTGGVWSSSKECGRKISF